MKQKSESLFGQQLTNAQNLAAVLAGFSNYQSSMPNASLVNFNQLIASIQEVNTASSIDRHELTAAATEMKSLVITHGQSISKLLSPINAAVKSQYGLNSLAAIEISAKIKAMRRLRAQKKAIATVDGKEQTSSANIHHTNSNSLTERFADLVAVISTLVPAYNPVNKELALDKLKATHTSLISVTARKATSHADWIKSRSIRDAQYGELKTNAKLIKESVKAQFGQKSNEYTVIKSFAI